MNPQEIPTTYNSRDWEDKLYSRWEECGFFNPETCIKKGVTVADAEPFSIVLPPPNVTGTLHAGHASMLAIEDAFVRYHRMKGDRTLWIPGTDHAAIATQSKVEKLLLEKEGRTRYDLGREEFLKRVDEFAQASHDTIVHQTKKMGSSLDWSREAFTLDDQRNRAVRAAFKRMHEDGIIYRGYRTINWSVKGQSTCSDDEVVYKTRSAKLYTFRYSKDFPIAIATTRPETKLGDTAVAVHPDDARYQEFVGKTFEIEAFADGPKLSIHIIADAMVDPAFGTGAVGITPAHSHTDYDFYVRHQDTVAFAPTGEPVIGIDGKITAAGSAAYAGLSTEEAREKVIVSLKEAGLLDKEEDIEQNVGVSDRYDDIIEVLPLKQWFVAVNKKFERDSRTTTLKTLMQEAVRSEKIEILPERFEKTYFHWIDNLRDWCISRQIWYGHRIPVWYCLGCGAETVDAKVRSKVFLVRHGETDWNKEGRLQGSSDMPLNETGREQARLAAESLKHENIGAIFSSDLVRAHETAEIIEQALPERQEIILDKRLQERHMGIAEGMRIVDVRRQHPALSGYEDKSAENESYKEVEERMWEALSEYLGSHPDKNLLVVSHGAAIRTLLRRIRNIDPESIMSIGRVPNATPIAIDILDHPCGQCGGHFHEQDSDTLDTWFSSGLWTFSTLGWPFDSAQDGSSDDTQWQRERIYHPTSLLETGYDILFFWVARMILMSTYLLGEVPFKTVYLHGLVRDEQGRKMSKSLGNIIDPLDVIAEYGADALRLALVVGSTPGNDLKLSDEKIIASRNFTNKLWNIGRYINQQLTVNSEQISEKKTLSDTWILARLDKTVSEVTGHLERYNLSLAAETLRDFTWNEFADWYLEIHKMERNDTVLRQVFETLLRLWHPFMPFVTEAVFQTLHPDTDTLLMVEKWPFDFAQNEPAFTDDSNDDSAITRFEELRELIKNIRNIRSLYRIDPKQPLAISLVTNDTALAVSEDIIKKLARVSDIGRQASTETPKHSARITGTTFTAFVRLEDVIDIDKERARLTKEQASLRQYQTGIKKRLGDGRFVESAPAHVVEQNRQSLEETKRKLEELDAALANLVG